MKPGAVPGKDDEMNGFSRIVGDLAVGLTTAAVALLILLTPQDFVLTGLSGLQVAIIVLLCTVLASLVRHDSAAQVYRVYFELAVFTVALSWVTWAGGNDLLSAADPTTFGEGPASFRLVKVFQSCFRLIGDHYAWWLVGLLGLVVCVARFKRRGLCKPAR